MLIAAMLLGACATAPLFSTPDPQVCHAAFTLAGAQECVCSEFMEWDATPRAEWYEVTRTTVSNGTTVLAGFVYAPQPTLWPFALDVAHPRKGTRYRYAVRACNSFGCGPESTPVFYVGAPYACFDGGMEVACYVGDSLVTR